MNPKDWGGRLHISDFRASPEKLQSCTRRDVRRVQRGDTFEVVSVIYRPCVRCGQDCPVI